MKRDFVAPMRKTKIPISAAPMNRDLRPRGRDFRFAPTSSGEFKYKNRKGFTGPKPVNPFAVWYLGFYEKDEFQLQAYRLS